MGSGNEGVDDLCIHIWEIFFSSIRPSVCLYVPPGPDVRRRGQDWSVQGQDLGSKAKIWVPRLGSGAKIGVSGAKISVSEAKIGDSGAKISGSEAKIGGSEDWGLQGHD